MKCPVDDTQLAITERQGVEIDYCPTCRGVWLDRGELDKLIERAESYQAPRREERRDERYDERERHYDDDDDRDHRGRNDYHNDNHHDNRHGKRKKEGFLGDLFDF